MSKRVLFLSIAFITFIGLMIAGHYLLLPASLNEVDVLGEGWDVVYNDTAYTDIRLANLRQVIGTATQKGDTLVLSRTLRDLDNYDSPALMFETRFSAWRVIYDGRILNELYFSPEDQMKYIGCDNNFITLPADKGPAKLEIELLVSENDAYNYFESPVLGNYTALLRYVVFHNLFVFMASAFLILFGLLFFVISIAFRSTVPEIRMQTFAALENITLGVWFLTQFKLLGLFVDLHGHQTEIEYASLYLAVPFMYMVMGCMHNYLESKSFRVFAVVGTVVAVLPIVLHCLGLAHINRFLAIYQLDGLVFFIFLLVRLFKDSRKKVITKAQIIQLTGQSFLALSFIFNVIFYYMEVAGISEQIMLSKKAVPMGALMVVFATLVNYYTCISDSFARKKEYDSLAHLAYADGLTDIPNRSRYEKYLTSLSNQDDDYCIVSIDLNNLKTINDKQGHLMGDQYLKEFSDILNSCFSGKGFVARIGGDEFVAVLTGEWLHQAESILAEINAALDTLNQKDPGISRSAAYGWAFRSEIEGSDYHAVYLLADERMYDNKKRMKSTRYRQASSQPRLE